jgi:predicted KAP-like P-loop ATPase
MTKETTIEPDIALVDINNDALGVAELAKRISSSIVSTKVEYGLVIGLYGAWGSGKTTFINFIKQAFSEHDEAHRPIVLNFNPWLFSNHEDLIQRFLIELSKTLAPKTHKLEQLRLRFARGVENISSVSQELLVFAASLKGIPMVADSVKALNKLSDKAVKQLSEQKPLAQQKTKIENLLRDSKRKILVIIDDIDRLEANEIMDIFRMVKSVANFPNVIYLLSFDKPLICNIVKNFQSADGADYLEKIVQYEIDLPFPDPSGMLTLFGEQIDPTIDIKGGKKWDSNRWSILYRDYLRENLRTPRQVVRLSNSFNIAYPALRGEVDPVDFLGIEALRMFNPEVFYEVRRNAHRFTELGQDTFGADEDDKPYYDRVLNLITDDDKNSVKDCLMLLFPRVENSFSNYKSSTSEISEWRAQARICSSKHFGRYFSYSIQTNEFADAEIHETIKLTVDIAKFESTVIGYSKQISKQGKSRIPEFLELLLDIVKSGQADDYLKNIINNLVIVGDLIVREEDEERNDIVRIDSDMRIFWIINASLQRLNEDLIFKTLLESFKNTKSVHIPVKLLFYLGREHGLYSNKEKEFIRHGDKPYLSLKQTKELEEITLSIIRKFAESGKLLENIKLPSILYRWRDIRDSLDEPKAWATKITTPDDGLMKFLVRFSGISIISTVKETTEKIRIQADDVADFIDLNKAATRVYAFLDNKNISENERAVFEAFIQSYENKKNGVSDDWM